jgi:hypothetical protein
LKISPLVNPSTFHPHLKFGLENNQTVLTFTPLVAKLSFCLTGQQGSFGVEEQ